MVILKICPCMFPEIPMFCKFSLIVSMQHAKCSRYLDKGTRVGRSVLKSFEKSQKQNIH